MTFNIKTLILAIVVSVISGIIVKIIYDEWISPALDNGSN